MKKHNEFCIIQQQIEENANSDCDILRLTHGRWNRGNFDFYTIMAKNASFIMFLTIGFTL